MKQIEVNISASSDYTDVIWELFQNVRNGDFSFPHFIDNFLEKYKGKIQWDENLPKSGIIDLNENESDINELVFTIMEYDNIDMVLEFLGDLKCLFPHDGYEIFQISYRITDDVEHLFKTRNRVDNTFKDECCVMCDGEIFNEYAYEPFETIDDAIEYWCNCMGCKRLYKDQNKMVNYINGYIYPKYTKQHYNFQIHIYKTE